MDRPPSRKHAKAPESVAEQRFPARIVSSHAGGHWFESSSLHQKVPDFLRNQELFLFIFSNSDAAFWRFSLDPNRDPKAERSGKHRRGADGIIRPSPTIFVGYMVWLMTLPMAFRIFSWVWRKESGSNMVPILGDTNRWGLCGCFACSSTGAAIVVIIINIQNLIRQQEQLAICVLRHTPLDRLGQIVAVSVTALLVIAEIDAALLCAFNLCCRIALCCWIACGIRRKCYCRRHRQHH